MLYACDERWWDFHKGAPEFEGVKLTQSKEAAEKYPDVKLIQGCHANGKGLSFDEKTIHFGNNSGFQVLNLAYFFGATRIILIGYDMQRTNDKTHWHGDHPKPMHQPSGFEKWKKNFAIAAKQLKERNVKVINCTAITALNCFEKADLADVL